MIKCLWRKCQLFIVAATLCSCAPTANISSSKNPSYNGTPRKFLVAFSISPGVDMETVKTRMSSILSTCSVDTRYIFVEATYGGVDADRRKKLFDDARTRNADFSEDAVLFVSEKSKKVLVNHRYNSSRVVSQVMEASVFDRTTNAKIWIADISMTAGNVFQSNKDRAEVLSRNLMSKLIGDGIIHTCPDATVQSLNFAPDANSAPR